MNHYNNFNIQKFWNSPEAKLIDQLDLNELTKQALQAINKWDFIMLWPNKIHGLPKALSKQLGWQPSYDDVVQALKELRHVHRYIIFETHVEVKKNKSKFYKVYYKVNLDRIKNDLGTNENALF